MCYSVTPSQQLISCFPSLFGDVHMPVEKLLCCILAQTIAKCLPELVDFVDPQLYFVCTLYAFVRMVGVMLTNLHLCCVWRCYALVSMLSLY